MVHGKGSNTDGTTVMVYGKGSNTGGTTVMVQGKGTNTVGTTVMVHGKRANMPAQVPLEEPSWGKVTCGIHCVKSNKEEA